MAKKYTLTVNKRGSRPRSERLRKFGGTSVAGGGSTVVNVTSSSIIAGDANSHTHINKSALDKITIDEESYLYVDQLRETEDGTEYVTCTEKVKSGFSDEAEHANKASHADEADHANIADEANHAEDADNAEMWDNHRFEDYIDQPVRKADTVQHKELITDTLRGASQFVDGLLGSGYQLWQDDKRLVHLTLDKLTVRQSMVVLELLIERIRSVGGQIVVSAANGKIKTVEELEEYYRITFEQDNQFFPHDLIRCQAFTGGTIKSYWVEVADVVGDAVLVLKDEFEATIPEVGDECVLMGNTENTERQNLILISATEDGQPRIDVMNEVKSKNFAGCLRARFGKLDGIKDNIFPSDHQPQGYGLYADNAYLRGTFLLDTGEDIKTQFQIMEGKMNVALDGLRQDFMEDKGILSNPTFGSGMSKWNTNNEVTFFLAGNKWIWANGHILSNKENYAIVTTDNSRTVLHIHNRYIKQLNGNLHSLPNFEANRDGVLEAVPVYLSFFYKCTKPGTLKIEFENVNKTGFVDFDSFSVEEELSVTDGYKQYTCGGLWNGTGDFVLSFTGDIYLYMLVLSTDKIESLTYKYRTLFEQSEKLVRIAADCVDKDGNVIKLSELKVTVDGIATEVSNANDEISTIKQTVNGIATEVSNANGEISTIKQTVDSIAIIVQNINGAMSGFVTTANLDKMLKDGYIASNSAVNGILADVLQNYVSVEGFSTMFANAIDEKGLVKQADISAFITKNDAEKLISNIKITADNIELDGLSVTMFGVLSFQDDVYDSSTGKVHFGKNETSYTVISTSEEELGRKANLYLYNQCGSYGIVSTAKTALWAIGDVKVDGKLTCTEFSQTHNGNLIEPIEIELYSKVQKGTAQSGFYYEDVWTKYIVLGYKK